MKKTKEIIKAVMYVLELSYFQIRYVSAYFGIIHLLAIISKETDAELPCDYTWGERYILRIEYLRRRSVGIKCTFEQVEFEYLKDWNERYQEARKRFEEYRKQNPIEDALF